MPVFRLKACVRLPLNQILKRLFLLILHFISFTMIYTFLWLSAQATRIRMILSKTPLKVHSNLKLYFRGKASSSHIFFYLIRFYCRVMWCQLKFTFHTVSLFCSLPLSVFKVTIKPGVTRASISISTPTTHYIVMGKTGNFLILGSIPRQ